MPTPIPSSKGPSPTKAATMLREGVAQWKPITDKQKRFFAVRASSGGAMGSVKNAKRGKRPKAARMSPR